MITFGLALLIVFLVLAAQFESFVHPIIIMLSVPLAITGALATLYFTGITLNVYSQIGLVMLIGLVAKNAILIVEFANQLREQGRSVKRCSKGIGCSKTKTHSDDYYCDSLWCNAFSFSFRSRSRK